jgi:hypothetical protein
MRWEGYLWCILPGHSAGTLNSFRRFVPRKAPECVMYPWPIGNFDYVMDDALDIALNYLTLTGQAVTFQEVQSTAATAIAAAWRRGVRHRIRLANAAIKAVEGQKTGPLFK